MDQLRTPARRTLYFTSSIDDFGTGYSALSYLRHLPVDILKIDRTFTRPPFAGANPQDAAVVRTIVQICRDLACHRRRGRGDPGASRMLRELGCGLAQGFLYSNPLPPAAVAALLDGTTRGRVGTRPDGRERERCPLRANARGPAECLQRRNP